MATISSNGSKGHHKFTLVVTQGSQSVTNNATTVSYKLTIAPIQTGWDWNYSSKYVNCAITINGTTYTKKLYSYNGSSTVTLLSGSISVPHNSDGTKTLSFSFKITDNIGASYTCGNASASSSMSLTTIPRASSMTVPAFTIGTAGTISIARASSSFTHTIIAKLGDYSATIASQTSSVSISWTPPLSWANSLPNSNSGTATYTIYTYSGGTLIGTKSVTQTIYVPELPPKIASVSVTELEADIQTKFKTFVQGKSKLNIKTNAQGQYSATIKSIQVEIDSKLLSGADVDTGYINGSGTLTYKITVIDSRQKSTVKEGTIEVLAYSPPQILDFGAFRCDAEGLADNNGTRVSILRHFTITPLNNLNDKLYKIQYQEVGASNWTDLASGSVFSLSDSYISSDIFNINKAYVLRIVLTDYFNTDESISVKASISTGFKLTNWGVNGTSMKIGGWAQHDNSFELGLDVYFDDAIDLYIESGNELHSIVDLIDLTMADKQDLFGIGWLDPDYVELDAPVNTTLKTTAGSLNIRDAPHLTYSSVIGSIKPDITINILGHITTKTDSGGSQKFYRVIYQNTTGYCAAGYFNTNP